MRLNIYTIGWDAGGYGDGLCVVAANTAEEALQLANIDGWRSDEKGACIIKGAYFEGKPQVLDFRKYQD